VSRAAVERLGRSRGASAGDEDSDGEHRLDAGRADVRSTRLFGVRHQPTRCRPRCGARRSRSRRRWGCAPRRCAVGTVRKRRASLDPSRSGPTRRTAPHPCLTGRAGSPPRPRSAESGETEVSTRTSTHRHTKRSCRFRISAPGSSPASHRIWKPLQIPTTAPPGLGESPHLVHDRGEPRDGAASHVVAVGRTRRAGSPRRRHEIAIRVPQSDAHPAHDAHRAQRVLSSSDPGNVTTPILGRRSSFMALNGLPARPEGPGLLDHGVREQPLRHLLRLGLCRPARCRPRS
jgi:hypothetical protein